MNNLGSSGRGDGCQGQDADAQEEPSLNMNRAKLFYELNEKST